MSALDEAAPTAPVQSVDRALTILELLARDGEAGVTEIAQGLGVHKSTAFRLLVTLEAHRLVEQVNDRGRYRLGVGNLRLAGATTARLDLVTEARPVCRQLAVDTGETVNIAVRSETSALYLDQVAGSSALQPHNWVGQHIPLHATSNGKVLLSEMTESELKAAVRELPRFTDHDDHDPPPAPGRPGRGPQGRVRRRGRRARDRPDRRRGADPQRPRRHHRLDEHLGPDVPPRLRTPGRGGPPAGLRRHRGLPPPRLGPAHLSRGPVTRLTSAGHARTDLALPLAVNGTSGSQSHVDP